MRTAAVIIRPTATFQMPSHILAGHVIIAPRIIPFGSEFQFYLADGRVKKIVLLTEITTSPEAWRQNLHGFTYSGDVIEEEDLAGDALVSNLPYEEALRIYYDHAGDKL